MIICILMLTLICSCPFHHCTKTGHAWNFAKTLLYRFVNLPPNQLGHWPDLTWQQCLLGSPLPKRLKDGRKLWSLLRGSVLWLNMASTQCNLLSSGAVATCEVGNHPVGSSDGPRPGGVDPLPQLHQALSGLYGEVYSTVRWYLVC